MAIWHRIPEAAKIVLLAAALMTSPLAASASFALGPVSPALTQAVIDRCAVIAEEEARGDNTHRGQCVTKTGDWIAALRPAAAAPEDDIAIADLVVKLADLSRLDPRCTIFDTEIAEAINLARAATYDPEQKVRIEQISFTIGKCVPQVRTAAISASPSL